MRIFRLSSEIFEDEFEVYRYLCRTLPDENDWYFYEAGKGKVAEVSVNPGDYILFSYQHNILGIGMLESGRLQSNNPEYKYCYKFRPGTIYIFPLGIKLNDLHHYLQNQNIDVGAPFTERQDWPIISNNHTSLILVWLKNKLFSHYDQINFVS
jgi:hypothetical protein